MLKTLASINQLSRRPAAGESAVRVDGFFPGSRSGGGIFRWDPSLATGQHDGGVVIAPDVLWNGQRSTLPDFFHPPKKGGETAGCWVRVADGPPTVAWFGGMGLGQEDETLVVGQFLDYCARMDQEALFPKGIFLVHRVIVDVSRRRLRMRGEGAAATIFRRPDAVLEKSYDRMIQLVSTGQAICEVSDLTLDGNARANPLPMLGDRYTFQQSHCLAFVPKGDGFNTIECRDIVVQDPTADGLSFTGNKDNVFGEIRVSGIEASTRQRSRSDITVTGGFELFMVSRCRVQRLEIETNSHAVNKSHRALISHVTCDSLDVLLKKLGEKDAFGPLVVEQCEIRKRCFVGNFDALFSQCSLILSEPARLIGGRARFESCRFQIGADFGNPKKADGLVFSVSSNPERAVFHECEFSGEPPQPGFAFFSNRDGLIPEPVRFEHCRFHSATVPAAQIGGGRYVWEGCEFRTSGPAVIQANSTVEKSELTFSGNKVLSASGYLWRPPTGGKKIRVWMRDNQSQTPGQLVDFQDYDTVAQPYGPAREDQAVVQLVLIDRYFSLPQKPVTGKWIKGQVIYRNVTAASGEASGWYVVNSGEARDNGTFKAF